MKLGGIFRFELTYQLRRLQTWLFLALPMIAAFLFTRDSALSDAIRDDFFVNAPFAIATSTVVACLLWLLVAPSIAGDAAGRDIETGMDPLAYTVPVSKTDYLGGRFLAAFVLNALILLGPMVGSLLAVYSPGVDAAAIGPFRPAAYLTAYGFLALPNAFIATAIQFSLATVNRRGRAGYLGSMLLFFLAYVVSTIVFWILGQPVLARLIDPIGVVIITEVLPDWTPIEKRTRMLELAGPLLWNRVLWIGIALGALAFTHQRFQFAHHVGRSWWSRVRRRKNALSPTPATGDVARTTPIAVPDVARSYGFLTQARQTGAIAWASFRTIAKSWAGLALLGVIPLFAALILPFEMEQLGIPVLPRTVRVLSSITAPVTGLLTPWVIVPLLILFYAGELVWRERDAGLSETIDAAPVPESVLFIGKFLGLCLVLVLFMTLLTTAGILVQVSMGFHQHDIGLFLTVLFGLQLPEYILFAVLALVVHVLVDHKHVGHLVALLVYALLVFAPMLGVDHNLLIFGGSPAWTFTEMRGFDATLVPWIWFKLYWAAWALLLAVIARQLWVRGRESGVRARFRLAQRRFTGGTARAAAVAMVFILTLGGFIFYNTNVLHDYRSASGMVRLRAEYERRYRRYEGIPQPRLTASSLRVDMFPERREVMVRGTHSLVNRSVSAIDSIHVATVAGSEPDALSLDRPWTLVVNDAEHGHRIYALTTPLQPGDSLKLDFEVHSEPRGFSNAGVDPFIAKNGTTFPYNRLPTIGYQRQRELTNPRDRQAQHLVSRPLVLASLYDTTADYSSGGEGIALETIVSTSEDQTGVAPGVLRRTWTEGGRRYFHWVTSAPIGEAWGFYSARYAVRDARWNDVAIQVFHHPTHTANLDAMVRSVQASLDYYTTEFSPYPYSHMWLVEGGGNGIGLHAEASQIVFTQGFTGWGASDDPRALELPFATVAHEMAHQWWPGQLHTAMVEGAPLLSEGLAWYSGMQVVKRTYGAEHLRRLMTSMREPNPFPRIRRGVPLIRADDPYAMYRRGPFAMYALSQYIGEDRVNGALRRLIASSHPGAPLITTLDLYRELQAATPDSLRPLLHDLFEANTFWSFDTKQATAAQTDSGTWRVTLDVTARKEMVDSAGVETTPPMDDLVEIGIFAPAQPGEILGKLLYLEKHRVHAGTQTITVTVREKPDRAGIDPYNLLDWEQGDNIEGVTVTVGR